MTKPTMKRRKKNKTCIHVVVLKKQLFKNKTVHLARVCDLCGRMQSPNYAARTRENLSLATGWRKENEETTLMDELMGLKVKKIDKNFEKPSVNVMNVVNVLSDERDVCGICGRNCGKCKLMAFCPCHWP